jgi:hypothetical protein
MIKWDYVGDDIIRFSGWRSSEMTLVPMKLRSTPYRQIAPPDRRAVFVPFMRSQILTGSILCASTTAVDMHNMVNH